MGRANWIRSAGKGVDYEEGIGRREIEGDELNLSDFKSRSARVAAEITDEVNTYLRKKASVRPQDFSEKEVRVRLGDGPIDIDADNDLEIEIEPEDIHGRHTGFAKFEDKLKPGEAEELENVFTDRPSSRGFDGGLPSGLSPVEQAAFSRRSGTKVRSYADYEEEEKEDKEEEVSEEIFSELEGAEERKRASLEVEQSDVRECIASFVEQNSKILPANWRNCREFRLQVATIVANELGIDSGTVNGYILGGM